jgi:effector-binding domain-containing protein
VVKKSSEKATNYICIMFSHHCETVTPVTTKEILQINTLNIKMNGKVWEDIHEGSYLHRETTTKAHGHVHKA